MRTDRSHLLADALKLPPEERAALAAQLLARLDEEPGEGVEEAWAIEIKKRLEQIGGGEVEMIPWELARRRILGAQVSRRKSAVPLRVDWCWKTGRSPTQRVPSCTWCGRQKLPAHRGRGTVARRRQSEALPSRES